MRLVVLASGDGSNFEAIVKATKERKIKSKVVLLIVDKADAYAIKRAQKLNVDYQIINLSDFASKEDYEFYIVSLIKKVKGDLICLAGYMKIVSKVFLEHYEGKIINIHPSLLPDYPGKDALKQSLQAKEKVIGATVHYVNKYVDDGEIIDQISFNIETLKEQEIINELHKKEHLLYTRVIKKMEEDYEKSIN